jgi:hypothetical protein
MRFHAFRKTLVILGTAFVCAGLTLLLPTDRYQQWQLLNGTIHARAKWIYERVHYDPTPIDVAFVGSSRFVLGIDAPRIAQGMRAKGMRNAQVVNFSLAEAGRNVHDTIIDEMLTAKKPKLIVIGVQDKPARFGHPAYKYLASERELLDPGYALNAQYFSDLAYLPFRQMKLFAADLFPSWFGLSKTYDREDYLGSSVDTTFVQAKDGRWIQHDEPGDIDEIMATVRYVQQHTTPPILPRRYADLEFGDERHYVRSIVEKAHARGIKVAFLGLPSYLGDTKLQEGDFYQRYGTVWNRPEMSKHAELYYDFVHLTSHGADMLSDSLVDPILGELKR